LFIYFTNPNDPDTDNDGIIDSLDLFKTIPIEIPLLIFAISSSSIYIFVRNRSIKRKKKSFQSNIQNYKSNLTNYQFIFNTHIHHLEGLINNLIKIGLNYNFESFMEKDLINEYQNFKKFIGINDLFMDLSIAINRIETYLNDLEKNYKKVGFKKDFRVDYLKLEENKRISEERIAEFLKIIRKVFHNIFVLGSQDKLELNKNAYRIKDFNSVYTKFTNFFDNQYKNINENLDDWLTKNILSQINDEIKKLELSFSEIEVWFQSASKWANNLQIPKGYGFHLELSEKWSIYSLKRDEFKARILLLKDNVEKSVRLTRDFISWNIVLLSDNKNKINKERRHKIFAKLKKIEGDEQDINTIIKEDIENLKMITLNENKKMNSYFKLHDTYPIEDLIVEWDENYKEFNNILEEIRSEIKSNYRHLARFIKINKALFSHIQLKIIKIIKKYERNLEILREKEDLEESNQFINSRSAHIKKIMGNFESYYVNLCNNLPFRFSEISISFFIFDWEDHKEKIMELLNQFKAKKFQFKCDIMQEYLDPYTSEIWECSNCKALSCNQHLEKWFIKKGTPQCFKCGLVGTFSKKNIQGLPKHSKTPKLIKKEWIELLSCKACGKKIKILSFKTLSNKDLQIKTSCEEHLKIINFILPYNLSSEWIDLVETHLSEDIITLFLKLNNEYY